jgi:hypothetical protein
MQSINAFAHKALWKEVVSHNHAEKQGPAKARREKSHVAQYASRSAWFFRVRNERTVPLA